MGFKLERWSAAFWAAVEQRYHINVMLGGWPPGASVLVCESPIRDIFVKHITRSLDCFYKICAFQP